MTEGRDSHYQPWLRDDADGHAARGRPIRLQERLQEGAAQARIARGQAAQSDGQSGGQTGSQSGARSGGSQPDAGFEYAPRLAPGTAPFDDNVPLGLDLDGYYQDRHMGRDPASAPVPAPGSNDHMGQDYYAAARAARDASATRDASAARDASATRDSSAVREPAPLARQRMRLDAVRLDGGQQDIGQQDRGAPYSGHLDRIPGDHVAPLQTARGGGESWGDLAATSGKKAISGIRNGLSRFADWTIDLGARADIPARVAALRLDEKAKAAATRTADFSKNAAARTAEISKGAAHKTAEISKGAATRTAEVSKNAAAKTAATAQALTSEGKERVGKLELGSKLGDVAGKASGLVKQGASSVADATKAAGDSVAGAVSGAVSGAASQVSEKTSQIGFELGRGKAVDPSSIPSALEQLLAEEEGLATPLTGPITGPAEPGAAKPQHTAPIQREAPALPLFAEVPETVPTHIAPKRGSAFAADATLFDADPRSAAAATTTNGAAGATPTGAIAAASVSAPVSASVSAPVSTSGPLIIMPGESDTRDHNPAPEPKISADDADAVIIPVKPREPSAFAQRWMQTKDRLGDRWAAFQTKAAAAKSGGTQSGETQSAGAKSVEDSSSVAGASALSADKMDGFAPSGSGQNESGHESGNGSGASGSPPPSPPRAAIGGLLTNSTAFVGLGSLLIAGAMYSAAGALPPRGLSQEIASGSTPPLAAAGVDRADRAEIEAIVHDYILEHPEIIPQALERYQAQQMAEQIDGLRSELETPFAGAWTGAAKGDVILVEFSDFACGYCRKSVGDVERLLKNDPKLKVVHRELPILSPESGTAAKTALAAAKQGKYRNYYLAQFALGRPSPETIEAASKKAGLDPVATQKALLNGDIQAEIDKNMQMAQQLSFSGTPTFIVGDRILQGAVGYDELKKAVAEARAGD